MEGTQTKDPRDASRGPLAITIDSSLSIEHLIHECATKATPSRSSASQCTDDAQAELRRHLVNKRQEYVQLLDDAALLFEGR